MSHDFRVVCKCGAATDEWNHAEKALIKAVEDSYILFLLKGTSWGNSLGCMEWDGFQYRGLAEFLANHFDHGGFVVQGEYQSDDPVDVKPKAPIGVYEEVCKDRIRKELDAIESRVRDIRKQVN